MADFFDKVTQDEKHWLDTSEAALQRIYSR